MNPFFFKAIVNGPLRGAQLFGACLHLLSSSSPLLLLPASIWHLRVKCECFSMVSWIFFKSLTPVLLVLMLADNCRLHPNFKVVKISLRITEIHYQVERHMVPFLWHGFEAGWNWHSSGKILMDCGKQDLQSLFFPPGPRFWFLEWSGSWWWGSCFCLWFHSFVTSKLFCFVLFCFYSYLWMALMMVIIHSLNNHARHCTKSWVCCGELYRQGTCIGGTYILVVGGRQQTNNKQGNFTVDKYSKDSKQDGVNNGRGANLHRYPRRLTIEPATWSYKGRGFQAEGIK